MRTLNSAIFLVGCVSACGTPFIEVGAGYSAEAGFDIVNETGAVGHFEAGIEFDSARWFVPTECGYYHRSMLDKRPEIVTNDIVCKKRIHFGEK